MFSKYHYLSHNHNHAARVFIAQADENIVGFISVLHFPHPKHKRYKKVHRLVVLPDYQGLGIGIKLLELIGDIYLKDNFIFGITTNSPSLIFSLKNNVKFNCIRIGRTSPHSGLDKIKSSFNKITVSYRYMGKIL